MKKTKSIYLPIVMLLAAVILTEANAATITETKSSLENVKSLSTESNILNSAVYDVTNWSTSGRQILLNGKPFFAKGMGYQPVPVGEHPNNSPNGDYFTSNYAHIYEPDVDRMKAMGVNAIKIYSWYPDKDHTPFLNYCYARGIYVLVGYFMPPGTIVGEFQQKLALFKTLAQMTNTHPAIMGYMLGNENIGGDLNNPTFWNNYNAIAAALKQIAPNKLTTTGLVDDGMKSVQVGNNYMTSLDVWGINVFRGKTMGDFYSTYMSASKKPVWITEIGFPNSVRVNGTPGMMPDNGKDVAEYVEDVLEEIFDNSSDDEPDDPIGGIFYFMFSDEWWKQECPACWSPNNQPCACAASTHDFTLKNYTDNFPGKYWDEEWFGAYTADRQPRAVVDVLKTMFGK